MAEHSGGRDFSENEKVGHNRQQRAKIFSGRLPTGFEGMNYEQPRAPFQSKDEERHKDIEERQSRRD